MASTARARAEGSKDSKDETGVRTRTRTRIRLNVGIVESADTTRKTVEARRTPTKVVRKGSTNPRMQRMLTILTRRNPANVEPKVEIGGVDMIFLDVDELQQQGSEWIKIGVDTVAGKTAWPQSVTYGKKLLGDSDLTFRAQQLENLSRVASDCMWRVATIRDPISEFEVCVQAPVCKPLLSVGEHTTMGGVTVLHGDKGYMFHKGSNVAKKIDAWIQKELRDSQYRGCTIAYKENNVYNIYMKPRGNKIDAMPVSEDSDNRSSGEGVAGRVRTRKTGESRSRSSRRSA